MPTLVHSQDDLFACFYSFLTHEKRKKKKKVNLMGFAIHFSFVREHFLQTVERLFPSIEKFVLMWLKCTI